MKVKLSTSIVHTHPLNETEEANQNQKHVKRAGSYIAMWVGGAYM